MREFFVLSHDDRGDFEAVSDYDMDEFDLTAFWTGQEFGGSIPATVRLWVNKGNSTDYMGNPLSWTIASKRLWSLIEPLVGRDCQELIVPLYYQESRELVTGYVLLNPTRCLHAAKKTRNADVTISDLALDPTQIPPNVHMFRLAESSTVVIVSDAIVKVVWGKKLKGVAFLRTVAT